MVKRHKGPPARPSVARHNLDRGEVISELPPAEAVSEFEAYASVAAETHTSSVHDALLETVSPEAIEVATGQPEAEDDARAEAAQQDASQDVAIRDEATWEEPTEAVQAAPEAEPSLMEPPEALEAPEPSEVTETSDVSEAFDAASVAVPDLASPAELEAVVAPETSSMPAGVVSDPFRHASAASVEMFGELTEANATILAFLQSEGSAAVAHWQSLSCAKSPADALRIQVDEMQRAADASLTCFSALARRAGRLASGIGRA